MRLLKVNEHVQTFLGPQTHYSLNAGVNRYADPNIPDDTVALMTETRIKVYRIIEGKLYLYYMGPRYRIGIRIKDET